MKSAHKALIKDFEKHGIIGLIESCFPVEDVHFIDEYLVAQKVRDGHYKKAVYCPSDFKLQGYYNSQHKDCTMNSRKDSCVKCWYRNPPNAWLINLIGQLKKLHPLRITINKTNYIPRENKTLTIKVETTCLECKSKIIQKKLDIKKDRGN